MKMQSSSPESAVIRNYLDKVISLPWGYCTEEYLDIEHAQKVLDDDHYGLSDVKERIVFEPYGAFDGFNSVLPFQPRL